jgi:hypothetical protein
MPGVLDDDFPRPPRPLRFGEFECWRCMGRFKNSRLYLAHLCPVTGKKPDRREEGLYF